MPAGGNLPAHVSPLFTLALMKTEALIDVKQTTDPDRVGAPNSAKCTRSLSHTHTHIMVYTLMHAHTKTHTLMHTYNNARTGTHTNLQTHLLMHALTCTLMSTYTHTC